VWCEWNKDKHRWTGYQCYDFGDVVYIGTFARYYGLALLPSPPHSTISSLQHTQNRVHNAVLPILPRRHSYTEQPLTRIHTQHFVEHTLFQHFGEIYQDALNGPSRLFPEAHEVAAGIDILPDDGDGKVIVFITVFRGQGVGCYIPSNVRSDEGEFRKDLSFTMRSVDVPSAPTVSPALCILTQERALAVTATLG
jgi:hypothetical protein